jgi:hypothetical protein
MARREALRLSISSLAPTFHHSENLAASQVESPVENLAAARLMATPVPAAHQMKKL